MNNTKEALVWIVGILQRNKIPFRVGGGFAARIYGSKRKLADIDIGIEKNHFSKILSNIKEYIVEEPNFFKDKDWDLYAARLNYKGQYIDIVVINSLKFFNKKEQKWEDLKHTFSDIVFKEIYGIKIPVISRENLIEYKSKLGRKIDLIDVKEILKVKNYEK
jgi:hypothetical protein